MSRPVRICVFGAGSIGCYVGGRLAQAGASVAFVGRERLRQQIARRGLRLTDYRGEQIHVPATSTPFGVDPGIASSADLILVTVKSSGTLEAARTLSDLATPAAVVISFQN